MASEEKETPQITPITQKGQDWKPKQERKRTFVSGDGEQLTSEHEEDRQPAPLPFGKLDILA
ncbi:MAG: hypothetical protein NTW14_00985 [bacterium]|nr:hypothetical protein [bacterium]